MNKSNVSFKLLVCKLEITRPFVDKIFWQQSVTNTIILYTWPLKFKRTHIFSFLSFLFPSCCCSSGRHFGDGPCWKTSRLVQPRGRRDGAEMDREGDTGLRRQRSTVSHTHSHTRALSHTHTRGEKERTTSRLPIPHGPLKEARTDL